MPLKSDKLLNGDLLVPNNIPPTEANTQAPREPQTHHTFDWNTIQFHILTNNLFHSCDWIHFVSKLYIDAVFQISGSF